MKRINAKDNNDPEAYDAKFVGTLGAHDMKRFELLAKNFKGGVYADIGCFDSPMPALLAERYPACTIYAFDHAPKMIAFLAERFPKVKYKVANCYSIPLESESVDYVVAGEIIEHLEKPADAIKEWLRILKPGGTLAVSTPFEEQGTEVGGIYHLWQWTLADMADLGFTETDVIMEANYETILAWQTKK